MYGYMSVYINQTKSRKKFQNINKDVCVHEGLLMIFMFFYIRFFSI